MADDPKPTIPGPKPGEAAPAAKPAEAKPAPTPKVPTLAEQVPQPEPAADSFQTDRAVDPHENHDFLEEDFKRDQSAPHTSEMSPAEIVASTDPEHTIAKGLTADGQSANGMVDGDRPLDRN